MAYPTTPLLGINLAQTFTTLNGVTAGKDPPQIGSMVQANDGSQWIFAQASTTIAANYAMAIDSTFKANPLTAALCTAGNTIAWAEQAIDPAGTSSSNGPYFWAQMQGRGASMNIAVAASCAAGVPLYTTSTAGVLDDSATATQALVPGVATITTMASTTGLAGTPAIVTYAHAR
jgi:hypothetical protein